MIARIEAVIKSGRPGKKDSFVINDYLLDSCIEDVLTIEHFDELKKYPYKHQLSNLIHSISYAFSITQYGSNNFNPVVGVTAYNPETNSPIWTIVTDNHHYKSSVYYKCYDSSIQNPYNEFNWAVKY